MGGSDRVSAVAEGKGEFGVCVTCVLGSLRRVSGPGGRRVRAGVM